MRKLLLGFLCAWLLVGFAGCGETVTTAPATTTYETTMPGETTTEGEGEPRDGDSLIDEIVAKIKDVFD